METFRKWLYVVSSNGQNAAFAEERAEAAINKSMIQTLSVVNARLSENRLAIKEKVHK